MTEVSWITFRQGFHRVCHDPGDPRRPRICARYDRRMASVASSLLDCSMLSVGADRWSAHSSTQPSPWPFVEASLLDQGRPGAVEQARLYRPGAVEQARLYPPGQSSKLDATGKRERREISRISRPGGIGGGERTRRSRSCGGTRLLTSGSATSRSRSGGPGCPAAARSPAGGPGRRRSCRPSGRTPGWPCRWQRSSASCAPG